jgi:hypothetical protein
MRATLLLVIASATLAATPIPKDASTHKRPANSNEVLKSLAGKFTSEASSEFQGWPVAKLVDGDEKSTWYTASGDIPARGVKPWARVSFPQAVAITRVTILGNHDPQYPTGYFATEATIDLLNAKGEAIASVDLKSEGDNHDFDAIFSKPTEAHSIRITITKDISTSNCIGLSEIMVE